ncbi:MAG: hypothetical protein WBV11_03985 [Salegentibacter sp.]
MGKLLLEIKGKAAYEELIAFLKDFGSEKLEIVSDGFDNSRRDLHSELSAIDAGTSEMKSLDDFDEDLEKIISEYEN